MSNPVRTRTGASFSAGIARGALCAALFALAPMLSACGSTNSAPVRHRDLVVANPVSVSPTISRPAPKQASPAPKRRPGAVVRAPRPGDDLSSPPSSAARLRPAGTSEIETSIKVAAGPDQTPKAPANPKPTSTPKASPKPTPTTMPTAAPPRPARQPAEWWKRVPEPAPGRLRIVASGVGENLRAAREAAVESGLAELRAALGSDPTDVTYERTTVQPEGSGRLRGYVLVSCDAP